MIYFKLLLTSVCLIILFSLLALGADTIIIEHKKYTICEEIYDWAATIAGFLIVIFPILLILFIWSVL